MTIHGQSELARALFEECGDALFLLDPDTDQLLDVNPVAVRLTGFAPAELKKFPATQLFRFEAPGGLQRLRGAFAKTRVFHSQDGFLLRSQGDQWIPVSLTVSRLHLKSGNLGLITARDERARRQAFAQLRRVEAELRQVLASVPAALWSAERAPGPDVTAGWQFRYVSPMLARLAGRPPEYFDHPFKWAEVVHPSDREAYRLGLRKLLTGSDPDWETLYRIGSDAGPVRWVRDRLQVQRDPAGRPVRLDGCLTDVTEQRQVEEALRRSEQRFRALVEKSRDGILLVDQKGVIRYASAAAEPILGYDPADLVGRNLLELVVEDDRAGLRKKFAGTLYRPGEGVSLTCRALTRDGSTRLIEWNACNRLDDPSVQAVVLNYRDVTEQVAASRELARQHSLLKGLFASIPDVLCYKDRELRFLGGNPAFEQLAGRPIAEVIGKTCADLFSADWAERLRALEPQVLASGETIRAKEWVSYPDGHQAQLDFLMSPLLGEDEKPAGLIVVGRDVTAQSRLEEELRHAQKLEAVGRLAGGIAHDFNNLLTVILGNLELVRSRAAGDETPELLAAIERAARQAADLTRQMLDFARRRPLSTSFVDLNQLVRDTLTLLRRTIDPRITIRTELEPDIRLVAADPTQIQQVLMNLCLNARDAMPEGGTLTISTATVSGLTRPAADPGGATKRFVRLSVSDTGVGMTEEVRAKIFEPFFTTKEVGQGTGLGLAVVYGVAQAHGGWVECTSAPGAGSRFDFYLPLRSTAEQPLTAAPAERPQPVTGQGETVLVADDEPLVRSLARTALERYGYRVLLAKDGAEVLKVFCRERDAGNPVRVVVLDASMPVLSGRQAYEALRRIDAQVPVVFASGHLVANDEFGGGIDFLPKPYTPTSLAAAVRRAIDSVAAGR